MPTIRTLTSIALADGTSHAAGETVEVTPERAQDAVSGGWGELVRAETPETPERAQARRQGRPERRSR